MGSLLNEIEDGINTNEAHCEGRHVSAAWIVYIIVIFGSSRFYRSIPDSSLQSRCNQLPLPTYVFSCQIGVVG
eukprot:scaffold3092_cov153-Skeletonema_marinoi.AAC.19